MELLETDRPSKGALGKEAHKGSSAKSPSCRANRKRDREIPSSVHGPGSRREGAGAIQL